jgi:hypothetical protein
VPRSDGPTPRAGSRPGRPDDAGYQGGGRDDEDDEIRRQRVAVRVNWEQYDAPNIWLMVANEGNRDAEDLVMAFRKLSQYVDANQIRLVEAGKELALAWSGSAAAGQAQVLLKEITDAMLRDTEAYVTATGELDNVVARLAESKKRVEPLYEQWVRLAQTAGQAGMFSTVVMESDVYKNELEHTNSAARDEMRKLDRDLEGARITTSEEFVPSTGVPSSGDLALAGLGPQAIEAAQGGGLGRGMLSGGGLPATASVVPGGGGLGGVGAGVGMTGPVRPAMTGVIGGDATSARPMAGGMMGGGMGGAHGGAGGGQGGGRADTQWETRHGVTPVIGATPPPDPSTMGVDDSFDKKQKRK